jgi:hypothetical protein
VVFLFALLSVEGIYIFREKSFGGLQKGFAATFGRERLVTAKRPSLPKKPATVKIAPVVVRAARVAPPLEVSVTVVPIEPKASPDTIRIGMEKASLWQEFGQPDATTSSREGDRFLETYIYLDVGGKATVARLVNGRVASVRGTRTISPPQLVPGLSNIRTAVLLAPQSNEN